MRRWLAALLLTVAAPAGAQLGVCSTNPQVWGGTITDVEWNLLTNATRDICQFDIGDWPTAGVILDMSGGTFRPPSGTTLPVTCTADLDFFTLNDSPSPGEAELYFCTATDTWTLASGGGSAPGGTGSELQYRATASTFGATNGLDWTASTGLLTYAPTLDEATGNEVAFDLSYTVNKAIAGNDTGFRLALTDTASPGISKMISAIVGATEVFSVLPTGRIEVEDGSSSFPAFGFNATADIGIYRTATNDLVLRGGSLGVHTYITAGDFSVGTSPTTAVFEVDFIESAANGVLVTPAAAAADPKIAAVGTDANIDLDLAGKGSGTVIIDGCQQHGKHTTAPSGAECDSYWDTDLNLRCWHNGTNWVQGDDWTTVCS